MISATQTTFAPSRVRRLAIIKPISPLPKITTLLPVMNPVILQIFCAVPAVVMPATLSPGSIIAPGVLS